MKIELDITLLAEEMKKLGFNKKHLDKDDFIGWSDSLLDLLEDKYELETLIVREIKNEK